jgi:hypothetical protein
VSLVFLSRRLCWLLALMMTAAAPVHRRAAPRRVRIAFGRDALLRCPRTPLRHAGEAAADEDHCADAEQQEEQAAKARPSLRQAVGGIGQQPGGRQRRLPLDRTQPAHQVTLGPGIALPIGDGAKEQRQHDQRQHACQ